jgi:hypothetical protein
MRRPEDLSEDRAGAGAQYMLCKDSKLLASIM